MSDPKDNGIVSVEKHWALLLTYLVIALLAKLENFLDINRFAGCVVDEFVHTRSSIVKTYGSGCNFDSQAQRFASSINGRFCSSVSSFHSAPKRFDISELCIFGFSCAILRRCPRDHTINAFIGLFI
uniref:Uncharacterized protein n=1 Tax=Glossina palpalis gambiensis TaxID=67801 RepID=A0A1B0AQS3_9MUSC